MNFIKSLFSSIQPAFIIKSYIGSAIMSAFLIANPIDDLAAIIWFIVCAVFFPFANVVVNDLKAVLSSGSSTVFLLPLPIMIAIKLGVFLIVFFSTPVVAPVGILYLFISGKWAARKHSNQEEQK